MSTNSNNSDNCNPSDLEKEINKLEDSNVYTASFIDKIADSYDRVANVYFRPKSIETWKDGRVYEYIGIKYLKRALKVFPMQKDRSKIPNTYFIWDSTKEGLKKFDYQTRYNETLHIVPTLLFSTATLNNLAEGRYDMVALDTCLNVFLGVGPLLLQRYNRARIHNLINKMDLKENNYSKT